MTEIIINKNKLTPYEDNNISITNKTITFKKNGEYTITYTDSTTITLDIILLPNVTIKLFIYSLHQNLVINHHYELNKNSNLLLFKFYYNKNVSEKIIVDLNGEYSKFSHNFSSVIREKEEYNMIVNHNNHHVSSSISNKCVGLDGSKITVQIDSILMKGNEECVMDQNTRILTLGDVEAKVIPNMFIDEDNVEARHGSVIGGFKEEDIFYLMSRGIPETEAITLLVKGFIFSNLIVDMEKRAMIREIINEIRR